MSVYTIVNESIIEQLKQGVAPWKQPYAFSNNVNAISKKPYNGFNILLLNISRMNNKFDSTVWLTFKQAKQLGGNIKGGSQSTVITFFTMKEFKEEKADGTTKIKKVPLLRYYNVFNLDQTERIDKSVLDWSKEYADCNENILTAENILHRYENKPPVVHFNCTPCYIPKVDEINIPSMDNFHSSQEYYSTLFHEMLHSTGHQTRLNRKGIAELDREDKHKYSFEELIAEIGASYLNYHAGIFEDVMNNSAAYIDNWLKVLTNKDNERWLTTAFNQSEKAVNYILNQTKENITGVKL